ncbi:MAG TPA: porin [Verrucomicrobiae bacterium]|nr:porin [Verrucomicrobiae bacterium]
MKFVRRFSLCAVIGVLPPLSIYADERDDRIRALEQRLEILEKRLGVKADGETGAAEPGKSEPPKPMPTLSIGSSGFQIRSADTNFALKFRGLLQVDSRWYVDDGGIENNDGFVLRRARPILEGTVFRDFEFRFTPEFGGSSTTIRDAWFSYNYNDALQWVVGKMKPPAGLERRQAAANIPFIERSLVSTLWPTRELGVMLQGELWPGGDADTQRLASSGLVHYGLGVFNGTGDGRAGANGDFDGKPEFAGRLFFHPFLGTSREIFKGIGLGLSGTYGMTEGLASLPDGGAYATEGQQDMFSYLSGDGTTPATASVTADGLRWRVGPQMYWYAGPFGLLSEYGISSQKLRRDDGTVTTEQLRHEAWSLMASWLVTGENATFRGVTPKRSFDPRAGGLGALQFVARYSLLDLDDDSFPTFADPTESATSANAWGVGLNWYLNRNVRASINFLRTEFEGGDSGAVTRQPENVFLTRVQLAF